MLHLCTYGCLLPRPLREDRGHLKCRIRLSKATRVNLTATRYEAAVVDGVEAHRVAEKARSALSSFAAAREKAGSSLGTGFEVTVADEKVDLRPTGAPFLQVPHKVFHDYNGTVPTAGAAYAQGEVRLAFGGVAGDEEGKQLAQVGEELYSVLLAQHRRPNRLVVAG